MSAALGGAAIVLALIGLFAAFGFVMAAIHRSIEHTDEEK